MKYESNPRIDPSITVAYSTNRFQKYIHFPLNNENVQRFPPLLFRLWMDIAINSQSWEKYNDSFNDCIEMYIERRNIFNKH